MSVAKFSDPTHVINAAPINFTAAATLTAAQSDQLLSNIGAAGSIYLTLPAAVPGLNYKLVATDAWPFGFQAGGTDKINALENVNNTHIYVNTAGGTLALACLVAGFWQLVEQPLGSWAIG